MASFDKLSFEIDLGFVKLGGDLSDQDRQCAWELYAEIATRVAVIGKRRDKKGVNFDGEIYAESLDSLYTFFKEARLIMRRFPVGHIKDPRQVHLGILINRILADVLRPFLERWNGRCRGWWAQAAEIGGSPFDIQKSFPEQQALLEDWTALRLFMRLTERTIAKQYKLVPLDELDS